MRKQVFRALARFNKVLLPSLTHSVEDLGKASKWQILLLGWKYWVTTHALED